jgi:phage N-6-adenine-methyltransferase
VRPADPKKGVWPTPSWLFEPLNARHRFDLDAAASKSNAKCARYFTEKDNALAQQWKARCFWNNPPYGVDTGKTRKAGTDEWVAYARRQVELGIAKSGCLLVPVKAETAWYQDLVWGECRVVASRKVRDGDFAGRWYRLREPQFDVEVLELRGRVSFTDYAATKTATGFFASALVFFNAPARPALLLEP